jgi:ribosomal protein L37AE/L43A
MTSSVARSPLRCPACRMYSIELVEERRARCFMCGIILDGPMLKTLLEILALPIGLGRHACEECEHPQMRLLPGGAFHCPACRSEVVLSERDKALS